MNYFKKRTAYDYPHVHNIHPLSQDRVGILYDMLYQNPNVREIIVFGSSVTRNCHNDSDVDLYVRLENNVERKDLLNYEKIDFPLDFWSNYMTDKRLEDEIKTTGVKIYG